MTDLHYDTSKANRMNYSAEVMGVLEQVLAIKEKYSEAGYSVKLVLLGDVVDGAMTQADEAMRCVDLLRFYTSLFSGTYAVLGNHEQTYTEGNPFWFLVSELADPDLKKISRALQPQSVNACIEVPATLEDGNVVFHFNHYGTPPKLPSEQDKVHIGLFHQNVGSNDICKMWGTFDDVEEASYVQGYNYCYFGHMHMAYGKYYLNEAHTCLAEWLGTACRTNVLEVENAPLEFNVPAVIVEEGVFTRVEDNYVTRGAARDVIDYAKLNNTRAMAEQVRIIREIVGSHVTGNTLFECVQSAAAVDGLDSLLNLLDGSFEQVRSLYKRGFEESIQGQESEE